MSADARRYPSRPFVGVGGVVVNAERRVLLVKRRNEPLAGRWSLPGGLVEVGESLESAVRREVREETGVEVRVGPLVDVVERVLRDAEGLVTWHYVLLDYACQPVGGDLHAGSDASEAVFVGLAELESYGITESTARVIRRGIDLVPGVTL